MSKPNLSKDIGSVCRLLVEAARASAALSLGGNQGGINHREIGERTQQMLDDWLARDGNFILRDRISAECQANVFADMSRYIARQDRQKRKALIGGAESIADIADRQSAREIDPLTGELVGRWSERPWQLHVPVAFKDAWLIRGSKHDLEAVRVAWGMDVIECIDRYPNAATVMESCLLSGRADLVDYEPDGTDD